MSIDFRVAISCDSAAFGNPNTPDFGYEIARILREVADKMQEDYAAGVCRDYHGNSVGHFGLRLVEKKSGN